MSNEYNKKFSEEIDKEVDRVLFERRIQKENRPFTEEDLDNCWPHYKEYLIDLLNADYDLEEAKKDLAGLIGSKYDKRVLIGTLQADNKTTKK